MDEEDEIKVLWQGDVFSFDQHNSYRLETMTELGGSGSPVATTSICIEIGFAHTWWIRCKLKIKLQAACSFYKELLEQGGVVVGQGRVEGTLYMLQDTLFIASHASGLSWDITVGTILKVPLGWH